MDQVVLLDRAEKQSFIFVGAVEGRTLWGISGKGEKQGTDSGWGGRSGREGVLRACSQNPRHRWREPSEIKELNKEENLAENGVAMVTKRSPQTCS